MFYAIQGLFWILKNERNFQIEILALLGNLFLIVFLKLSISDALSIFLVCFFVLMAEMINTALEKLCDLVNTEENPHIKVIKDLSAGAVLLAALASVVIAVLVYPKYIFLH